MKRVADYDLNLDPTMEDACDTTNAQLRVPSREELAKVGLSSQDADRFITMCNRYIQEQQRISDRLSGDGSPIIRPPPPETCKMIDEISPCQKEKIPEFLNKLIMVKLNGGLGTTMGLNVPRCALSIGGGKTFLDVIVRQVESLNRQFKVNVPLLLMNSIHTHDHVQEMLAPYKDRDVRIQTFLQSCFPRMHEVANDLAPQGPLKSDSLKKYWYPPGSGDVFESFYRSGLLEKYIAEGKEWMLLSSVENLGAVVDHRLLTQILTTDVEFVLEVVERKLTDERGGVLVQDLATNRLDVIQLSQVPRDRQLLAPKLYKYWSTNNIWVKLTSLLSLLKSDKLTLGVSKNIKSGYVQLETYAASAIQRFNKSMVIVTPRHRLLQIKTTADLFLLQSNTFVFDANYFLSVNPAREALGFLSLPSVRFDKEHFGKLEQYQSRFRGIPNVAELEYLNVAGDVIFGFGVALKGTVIVVAEAGSKLIIPDGAVLENCVVTGALLIVDH